MSKEYEVIAYRHIPTTTAVGKDVVIYSDNKHWDNIRTEDGEYEIFSIQRLSDGELFSIGDKLLDYSDEPDDPNTIVKIGELHGGLWLYTDVLNRYGTAMSNAKKEPEPKEIVNMDGETVLEEASRLIFGDRRAAYGDVHESFNKVAVGWEVLFGVPITPEQVSMAMVWLKLCREANKPGRDNVVDLIGYAALIDEIKKAKNK